MESTMAQLFPVTALILAGAFSPPPSPIHPPASTEDFGERTLAKQLSSIWESLHGATVSSSQPINVLRSICSPRKRCSQTPNIATMSLAVLR